MKIFNKFKIINSFPALWIDNLKTIVISDLHLGLESLMIKEGVYFPKFQLKEMKEDLDEILKKKPKRLIINGDLKHEFSKTTWKEKEEVNDLINFLLKRVKKINIVKGNHDNYLIYAVKKHNNVDLKDKLILNHTSFIHGHKDLNLKEIKSPFIVLGHEHPALALKDPSGIKEKIRCFLYGEIKEKKIIVMPAFSKLAQGSQVNQIPKDELLTPFLRKEGVREMKAIGVSEEGGLFEFPEVRRIK